MKIRIFTGIRIFGGSESLTKKIRIILLDPKMEKKIRIPDPWSRIRSSTKSNASKTKTSPIVGVLCFPAPRLASNAPSLHDAQQESLGPPPPARAMRTFVPSAERDLTALHLSSLQSLNRPHPSNNLVKIAQFKICDGDRLLNSIEKL